MTSKSPLKRQLIARYLPSKLMRRVYVERDADAFKYSLQLWVKENIPYAFKYNPWVYCELREYLAAQLNISISEITMIGSAKVGFSSKARFFGRKYNKDSDFDFTIISERLFEALRDDAKLWIFKYESGQSQGKNEKQRVYFRNNSSILQKNLAKGFIDPHYIPNLDSLKNISKINNMAYLLKLRLQKIDTKNHKRKISFRVYRSWECFERQSLLNFNDIGRRLSQNISDGASWFDHIKKTYYKFNPFSKIKKS